MATKRKMTASERRQLARIKAKIAARKAAEEPEEVEIDVEEGAEEQKEARRRAARRRAARRRAAMRRRAEDEAEKPDFIEEEGDKEQKEARARAARRAARMAMRRRAEVSDDLIGETDEIEIVHKTDEPSDDLVDDNTVDDQVQQTPPPSANEGEAEEKVAAAYGLVERQIAHKVIGGNVRKATAAAKICSEHTLGEIKFASEMLEAVGRAGKSAGNVRVQRRSAAAAQRVAGTNGGDAESIFY